MATINSQLVKKGLFALTAVAIVGTTTAAYAVTNATDNTTSGYGTGNETAIAASQEFDATYTTLTDRFSTDVEALIAQAKSQLTSEGAAAASDFEANFQQSTGEYKSTVADASATFRSEVAVAMNSGEGKDKFIDKFNNAKAKYFNTLDQAKNDLAAKLSNMGHQSNVVKDQFMNGYNSTRDMYGNDLEGAKNKFADRVSNNK